MVTFHRGPIAIPTIRSSPLCHWGANATETRPVDETWNVAVGDAAGSHWETPVPLGTNVVRPINATRDDATISNVPRVLRMTIARATTFASTMCARSASIMALKRAGDPMGRGFAAVGSPTFTIGLYVARRRYGRTILMAVAPRNAEEVYMVFARSHGSTRTLAPPTHLSRGRGALRTTLECSHAHAHAHTHNVPRTHIQRATHTHTHTRTTRATPFKTTPGAPTRRAGW